MNRLLLLSLLLPLALVSWLAPTPALCGEIRVLTYNIHHGEGRDSKFDLLRLAKLIKAQKPDLVALQEIDVKTTRADGVDQAAELGRLTEMHYSFCKFMDYAGGAYGQMVLSKHPILERENLELPDGYEPRRAAMIRVQLPQLESPVVFVGHHFYGTADQRLAQAAAVVKRFGQSDVPVLMAGDFNSRPNSPPMDLLRQAGWIDPASGDEGAETFPSNEPRRRIDYVLHQPQSSIQYVSSKVIDERVASDHRPVLTILKTPDPTSSTSRASEGVGGGNRPNILFVYTDDQSHRTVSCYPEAYDWVDTPNIDTLAARGVRFAHAYIGTWCMPSRATMLTGHHQYGVESMRMEGEYPASVYDPDKCPFWPKVLREHGYVTAQIGKWHTGVDGGFGRDWDHQIVWNRPKYPANAGHYYDDQIVEVDGEKKRISGYTTDWYTDRATDFIRGKNRAAGRPWYLWLCYGAVHGPFTPAKRHQLAYADAAVPEPADIYPDQETRAGKPAYVRERKRWIRNASGQAELESGVRQRTVVNRPLHGNTLQDWVRQYHQGVLALDEAVGRLCQVLKETGQEENTLIVFTSDQGMAWGQKGFQQKVAPYDANIRGPLIVSFPGRIPQGRVCPTPVGGTDLPPTFLAYAKVPLPWKMHGHDLTPLLNDPGRPWDHPALTVMTGQRYGSATKVVPVDPEVLYETVRVPWWVSLQKGRYKYIRTLVEGEVEELYDMDRDPAELVNLAFEPEHLDRLREYRAATLAELRRTGAGMADSLPGFSTPE